MELIESLAWAHKSAGDAAPAITQYEKLLAENSCLGNEWQQDWLSAHYHLAELYQSQGQKEKAQKLIARLLELLKDADPDLPLLRKALKFQSELGK